MPLPLPGERKQVTVLFADFSGYTAFSARLDPEDLRDNMSSIWASLDAIIVAHGGTPEKHIGDAVMAVFGGRRSREEDPAEAVHAALAMQAWLQGRPAASQVALQMRIGIHTGLAVVGPAEQAGEFLATGDTVNLAKRLEESAPVGGVLISRETYHLVFGMFDAQALPLLTVRGKPEPVESFLIVRAKSRGLAMQMRGIQGVETVMIGRQLELERLQEAFRLVLLTRIPQTIIVVGEAGMGKSRLFFEFQKQTELLPQYFRFFCGRATTEIAGLPFALIRDLFSLRFEILESDSAAVARDKLEQGLAGLLGRQAATGSVVRDDLMADIHFTGQLLGLDFSASPHLREFIEDTRQIRPQAFLGFSRLLQAISQCPPSENEPQYSGVLIVLEDLQWCDDGSLEMIEYLIRHCKDIPLMILCSARPAFFERRPDWCKDLSMVSRQNLEALSVSESNALVESILHQAREIPPALREIVTEGADGNPYFIEELIKMLMDQRVILPEPDRWQIETARLASARVPHTLTGVLQARLDGLSAAERWVLQRASVVGRVFWDSAVEQMGAADVPHGGAGAPSGVVISQETILNALQDLRRKGLIFRRESSAFAGAGEYGFKHELLRSVAYESLLKKSRRQHHARFAEWLKARCGDRLREFAPLIARHFELAGRLAEAAEWHGQAGQQARLRYSPATAIIHFKKALQLLPVAGPPDQALLKQHLTWQQGLVESLGAQGCFAEALEASQVARSLAQQLSDPVAEARAWNDTAFLHERRADNRASVECAEKAEILALQAALPGRGERIRALLIKAWAFYRLGDASGVLYLSGKLLNLCAEERDRHGTATTYKLLGVAHLQLGHYVKADHFFEQGLALFEELGDQRNTAAMWSNRGESARVRGDCERAVGLYERALSIARQIGSRESEVIYLTNVSGARLGIQQFERAETDLRQAIGLTSAPNSCVLAETFVFLSEACLGLGKLAEAIKTAQKAIHLAQQSENPLNLGEAWRALGRIGAAVALQRRQTSNSDSIVGLDTTDPGHCFAESLRVFSGIKAAGEQARTLRAWAEYDIQSGHLEPARQKLQAARTTFLQLEATPEVTATETLLGVQRQQDKVPDDPC